MQIENRTPFRAMALPGLDRSGAEIVTLIVKGTFALGDRGRPEAVAAADQVDIAMADESAGEPGQSPTKIESDLAMHKPATDLILIGFAYAPRGGTSTKFEVGFSVGRHVQLGELTFTEKSRRVALHEMERYEASSGWLGPQKGPFGFGYFPKNRPPRVGLAGTYDAKWSETRSPLLPQDFDDRFFQAAFPGLILPSALRGDEPVAASGVTPDGQLRTVLPGEGVSARAFLAGAERSERPRLDTVVLEPEQRRLVLVWRWMLAVGGSFSRVRGFLIDRAAIA
jgi:hypothetical protein